jgi:hypothetical protein
MTETKVQNLFDDKRGVDPLPHIPPALLNSSDIAV